MNTVRTLFLVATLCLPWVVSQRLIAAELIMIEQDGCVYCEKFNREIAQAYPKTEEGKRAPLRRINLDDEWPEDLSQVKTQQFTPTFILVENNKEYARLKGYPGDEYFWFLLNEMLDKLDDKARD